MNYLQDLFTNKLLIVPVISWALAQIIKTIIHMVVNKDFVAERLIGGGGMPSAHSATVCSLCTITALNYGCGGFEFAISAIFAIVTMYDAMNVRWETGKQGAAINDLIEAFNRLNKEQIGPDKAFKELIGHSPLQVLAGAILGIAMAFICYFAW